MKKRLMLGFIFFVFCFSLVFVAGCDDDQTIMRLYSSSNSHVSAWDVNVNSYMEEICYDDIFGHKYKGPDSHKCSGSNRILSLSSSGNAHVSNVHNSVYSYDVCYGDLSCEFDNSSGDSCKNGGSVIARVYDFSNTHVSVYSDIKYNIKICCSSGPFVFWTDMSGNEINAAEFGDTVRMVKLGSGSGVFDIKEKDLIMDDNIRTVNGSVIDGGFVGEWRITADDMKKTDGDFDKFYFKVDGVISDYLSINTHGKDDPMTVNIISPKCGSYYDQGDNVIVKINAFDNDDVINGLLTIDGESVAEFQNGVFELNKTFNVAGNSQVVVKVTNSRGEKARMISNIMVLEKNGSHYVDRNYIAACISKPKDLSRINGSVVEFDASSTRAIKVVNGNLVKMIPGKDKFSWYWKFMPENIKRELLNTKDKLAYQFTAEFSISGDNSASLRVEI